jgi:hypothetical protein
MSPQFMPLPLAKAKKWWPYLQALRGASKHLRGPVFFVLLGLAGRGGLLFPLCFSLFLPGIRSLFIMLNLFPTFPISSQCVPSSTTLYPICFAQRFIIVTYITSQRRRFKIHLFWECPKIWSHFHVMGQSKMPIACKKNLNVGCPHN